MIRQLSYITMLSLLGLFLWGCATAEPVARPQPQETPAERAPARRQQRPERAPQESEPPAAESPDRSAALREVAEQRRNAQLAGTRELALPPELPRERQIALQVDRILRAMPIEERLGQLLFPAIMKDAAGRPIRTVTEDVRALLEIVRPGGIILFGPNFTNLDDTEEFLSELQELSRIPLVFAVDQEGGIVSRLTESSDLPAAEIPAAATVGAAVGASGDVELARRLGAVVGAELRSLGIVMNFAPVADVNTNPANPVIRERAYGSDPEQVGRVVAAVVEGMQSEGVAAVLKHFPGHGDTHDDTHLGSATVYHDLERLRQVEFLPFRAGIDAGAQGVMTAHITVPEVLGNEDPATFSPELLEGILREELGFDGLLVTDSLAMAALINYYPQDEIVYRALDAGNDILLRPLYARRAYDALLEGAASGRISEERINRSVRKILTFKFEMGLMELPEGEGLFDRGSLGGGGEAVLGRSEHWEVIREIREAARGAGE